MMNVKAQLGKFITTISVLFFVVILMAFYIAFSAGITIFGDSPTKKQATTVELMSVTPILFKEIEFENEKIFVIDAVYLTFKRESEEGIESAKPRHLLKLHEVLQSQLLKEEDDCYLLYPKGRTLYGYALYDDEIHAIPPTEIQPVSLDKLVFYIEDKEISIFSYYGKCVMTKKIPAAEKGDIDISDI